VAEIVGGGSDHRSRRVGAMQREGAEVGVGVEMSWWSSEEEGVVKWKVCVEDETKGLAIGGSGASVIQDLETKI
jgi:hypothetical protein